MLNVYKLTQADKWNEIVKSFSNADVYYTSGYAKGFFLHGDGEPLLFHFENETVRGINVVMLRDIADAPCFKNKLPKEKFFDVSTPYGYGGWLIEGSGNKKELFAAYEAWCKENGIISEFVRFHPVLKNFEVVEDAYDVIPLGNTVTLDLESEDVIWANFTSKNRNTIRKAQKNNLTVEKGLNEEVLASFKTLYKMTMDKIHATDYYYFKDEYYDSILKELKESSQIFYVKTAENQIIAASIIFKEGSALHYHLSGSNPEYRNLAPTNLLLWEAALWGAKNGCKTFHLGGGVGSAKDALLDFKKSFYRGELTCFSIGKKIFDQEKYNMLLLKRDLAEKSNFFPEYRA